MSPEALRVLVDNQQRFLSFLERRLGDRAAADEVLQAAFLRGIEKGASLRNDENVVAWFYRLIRNGLAEHFRKAGAEQRALDAFAAEPTPEDNLEATVCACVTGMIEALKPEYASLLRAVDLEGRSVPEVARDLGISANNTGVRLHRARRALGRAVEEACGICCRNGCFDCDCANLPSEV